MPTGDPRNRIRIGGYGKFLSLQRVTNSSLHGSERESLFIPQRPRFTLIFSLSFFSLIWLGIWGRILLLCSEPYEYWGRVGRVRDQEVTLCVICRGRFKNLTPLPTGAGNLFHIPQNRSFVNCYMINYHESLFLYFPIAFIYDNPYPSLPTGIGLSS